MLSAQVNKNKMVVILILNYNFCFQKEPSSFCNECVEPKKIINGYVEVEERIAHYSCQEGFKIGNDYKDGRKCLKSSKWEGQREPYCRSEISF